jgi:hypothetical protein
MENTSEKSARLWTLADDLRGSRHSLKQALLRISDSQLPQNWRTATDIAKVSPWIEGVPSEGIVDFVLGYLKGRRVGLLVDPWAGPGVLVAALAAAGIAARIVARDPSPENAEISQMIDNSGSVEWQTANPSETGGWDLMGTGPPDLVVCAPPWGLPVATASLSGVEGATSVSESLGYLVTLEAASQLSADGEAILILPDGVLFGGKPRGFRNVLDKLGLSLSAVVSLPPQGRMTSVSNSLVSLTKQSHSDLFVGRAFLAAEDAALIENLRLRRTGSTAESGALTEAASFQSWWTFNLDRQVAAEKPEGQSAHRLDQIAAQIALGDRTATGGFEARDNAFYLPMIGNSPAVTSLADLRIKPQNVAQLVVKPNLAVAEYAAAFFNSQLGRKIRERMCGHGVIPRATKATVAAAQIYLPTLSQQLEAVAAQRQIEDLRLRLDNHARDLWERPAAAPRIRRALTSLANEDSTGAWETTLPFPLASVLYAYRAHADRRRRRDFLLHFFEATTEFSTVLMLSAFRSDTDFYAANRSSILAVGSQTARNLRRSTMGSWAHLGAHLAKETRRLLSGQRDLCLALFRVTDSTLPDAISSTALFGAIEQVTGYRNDWKGHGGVESDADVDRQLDALETELQKVRRALADPFEKVKVIRPLNSYYGANLHHYTVQDLTGPTIPFREISLNLLAPLEQDALHLCDIRGVRALQLLPFIRMRQGPPAPNACYFFNRIDGNTVRWVSYHHEEEAEVFESYPQLAAVFAELDRSDATPSD